MSSKERDRVRTRHWWKREDYAKIREKANNSGLTFSEYLRRCGLGRKVTSVIDKSAINTLLKLGGLQLKLSADIIAATKDTKSEKLGGELAAEQKRLYREIHKAIMAIRGKSEGGDDSGIPEKQ